MNKEARIELLKKAREAKALKAKMAKENSQTTILNDADLKQLIEPEEVQEVIEIKKKKPAKSKSQKTLNLNLPEDTNNEVKEVEEKLTIKAPKKKKVIKRIIEVEESDTEEEVIEEVVRIPKAQKEIKINRQEMVNKLAKLNQERLMTLLFP